MTFVAVIFLSQIKLIITEKQNKKKQTEMWAAKVCRDTAYRVRLITLMDRVV